MYGQFTMVFFSSKSLRFWQCFILLRNLSWKYKFFYYKGYLILNRQSTVLNRACRFINEATLLSEYRVNPKIKNRFLRIHSHVVKERLKSSSISLSGQFLNIHARGNNSYSQKGSDIIPIYHETHLKLHLRFLEIRAITESLWCLFTRENKQI